MKMKTASKYARRTTHDERRIETWSQSERCAWSVPRKMSVTEWAAANRYVSAESAMPGRYNPDLTPYTKAPMDAFSDPEVEKITIMAVPQIGKSTMIENMIGYCIDQDPGPTLLVEPRDEDIPVVKESRIKPMIEASPALLRHTSDSPRDLQGDFYRFDRMTLYFTAAGSVAGLSQKSIRYVFLDEPDSYPPFSGKEANPVDLAEKRTTTFWDSKIVMVCKPTTKSGYVYLSWEKSNKQKLHIPCPHCGQYRVWEFEYLRVPKTLRDPDKIIETNDVWYECPVCAKKIEESAKPILIKAGIWVPDGQSVNEDGTITGEAIKGKRHSGFQISALVSSFEKIRWARIMARWFEANTEEGIAAGKRFDFSNTVRGEPFEPAGKQLQASEVKKLAGFFSQGTVPADCVLLVAGCDYHKSETKGIVRIDYEVSGFAIGGKNYVIDTGSAASFEQLDDKILKSPFPWSDGTPNDQKPWLAVSSLFIDSGYKPDDVYDYCRRRPGLTIPTKGEEGPCIKPLRFSDLETATERRQVRKRSRMYYQGMQLMIVDTYFFKNMVANWAEPTFEEDSTGKQILKNPPLMSVYNEMNSWWFTEFTNEKFVSVADRNGQMKYSWQPVIRGAATHALDCRVLAAAAAFYKGIQYARRRSADSGQRTVRRIGKMER